MFDLLDFLAQLFVTMVGFGILIVAVLYVVDRTQTRNAVRRNFPVIGRFRYLFEHLGEFFRQYFFAMDREEMPFNRAERSWVYRAAKGEDTMAAFGSTRDLKPVGSVIFVNCPYPTLEQDAVDTTDVTIGPYCEHPYTHSSVFNISGMSYGAISRPAVTALSNGARMAGVWMNTGEGALSPMHLEGGADIVFQIGTAKYGVRNPDGGFSEQRLREIASNESVRMFEIKLSQGAKPGKGGILPGEKVTDEIASIRFIEPGQDSISPNRHPEIDSEGDLLDMIAHVRGIVGKPTGFKTVIGAYGWIERLCEEVHRRGIESAPDFITVRQRRWRQRGGADESHRLHGSADQGKPAARRRYPDALRFAGTHQGRCERQDDHARRSGVGTVCRRGFRGVRPRLHVRAGLHSGPAVQQEHVSHGRHHA